MWASIDLDPGPGTNSSTHFARIISCGPAPLVLVGVSHSDETAAGNDGTGTITATGGVAPLVADVVETGAMLAASSGVAATFTGSTPGTYTLRITDAIGQFVTGPVTILPYVAPVTDCTDPEALNYNATPGTITDNTLCVYPAPRWRSAWQAVEVAVAPPAGNTSAFVIADLIVGLPAGHPYAGLRPQGPPVRLRATISPGGTAVFRLGPHLRPALGASAGAGRVLDRNSPTATTLDLFTGYVLQRPSGEVLERGYVLNAAVPDAQLVALNGLLTPFARVPLWPGFTYDVPILSAAGRYGVLDAVADVDAPATVLLPCPLNPLPVCWLAPGSGYGYWVFQGRPQQGDEVGEGQQFVDALSRETRWSQRGDTRSTWQSSSGVFSGEDLLAGLRTLWRSPQVWAQLEADGPWVPVVLASGNFPAGRLGVARKELAISFTEAKPQDAQGQ